MGAKKRKKKAPARRPERWRGAVLWVAAAVVAGGAGWAFSARRAPAPAPAPTEPAAAVTPEPGFEPTRANTDPAPAPAGMAWIPGGEFSMGSSDPNCGSC